MSMWTKDPDGCFLVMAVTPTDELYQLEQSRGPGGRRTGAYGVYLVDQNGRLHACRGAGFPKSANNIEAGIRAFRAWGQKNGYEVKENELRKAG